MNSARFRPARLSDLPALMDLTRACIAAMRSLGIEQWDEIYPAEPHHAADIAAGTLWLLEDGGRLIGSLVLDETLDPLWEGLDWQLNEGRIAAVHRLMIHPSEQGRGLAKLCMEFAEARAGMKGFSALRLDTFTQNPAAVALYEKRGFRRCGTAQMRKGAFIGMEKAVAFPQAGWPAPKPQILPGRHITLAPLKVEQDAAELHAISHVDDMARQLWRWLPEGPFPTLEAYQTFLRGWTAREDVIAFTVRDNLAGQFLGSISLMRITPAHGVGELGNIWYAPHAQRTAANTEACFLLLAHCFDDLGYRRMEWKCNAENEPSKRAAQRLGFEYEGIFKQHMVLKGRSRDTAWFAMTDGVWPARRAWFWQKLGY